MTDKPQTPDERKRLGELLRIVVDGEPTQQEHAELTAILEGSDDAKNFYLTYIQLHSEMSVLRGSQGPDSAGSLSDEPTKVERKPSASGLPFSISVLLAFAVAMLAVAIGWSMMSMRESERVRSAQSRSSKAAPETSPLSSNEGITKRETRPKSSFMARSSVAFGSEATAVIVRSDGKAAFAFRPGERLPPGVLNVEQGTVQLEFMSGAIVSIAGPAEIHLASKDLATVMFGTVSAHIPKGARGFVLNAPNAAVVDMGTAFSMKVDESGVPEVDVTSGEVELSLVGLDGTTIQSRRVEQQSRYKVDAKSSSLVSIESNDDFGAPEIVLNDDVGLVVPQDYVNAVVEKEPLLYWRFEEIDSGEIKNQMSDLWDAQLQTSGKGADAIRMVNGHVRFERHHDRRYLISADPLQGINQQPYSVEFWIKPDDLRHSSLLGIIPVSDTPTPYHLNVFEILTDTELIHQPGAFRFLHRNPPSHHISDGTNLISPGIATPAQWQHVVIAKHNGLLSMYVNGTFIKEVPVKQASGPGDFLLIIGQLNASDTRRQFSGGMDEIALYDRLLTTDEVRSHYQLMAGQNGLRPLHHWTPLSNQ